MAKDVYEDDPYAEMPVKDFSYTNNPKPVSKKPSSKKNNRWIAIAGAGVVVILLAAGAVLLFHHKHTNPAKKSANTSTTKSANSFDLTFAPSTTYSSTNYFLSVTYPKDWTLNDNTTALTILSPETKLENDLGKIVEGKELISVFNQGQIPSAFGNNQAVAVIKSQLMSYSNPTQDQASQTYLSFVQYPATTVLGGLDAIYLTGNDGYTKGQNIPNSDISGVDPLVIISFLGCSDLSCSTTSPLSISSSEWSTAAFSSFNESLLKSFIFD